MELGVLIEVIEENIDKTIKDMPKGENVLFYKDRLQTIQKVKRTIRRLKRSKKKEVQQVATEAYRAVEGVSPSALASNLPGFNLQEFRAAIKASRSDKGDVPSYGGEFADLFFKADSNRRKRFNKLIGE